MSADNKAALADPENQEKWNQFKGQSEAEDQRRNSAIVASQRVFDVQQLLGRAATIHEVEVPGLGRVRFGNSFLELLSLSFVRVSILRCQALANCAFSAKTNSYHVNGDH